MENYIGLKNINSICYLNALIQSLLSCDKFIKAIKENKDNFMRETNVIGLLFYNIINKMENNITVDTDNYIMSLKLNFIGENCSHEALTFIIDKLHFENLFNIKHEKTIYCTNCDEITHQKTDTSAMYEYFAESNDKSFTDVINRQIETINNDYKCDICNKKKKHIFLHDLILSGEIFVIMFNQYEEKKKINYEKKLNLSTGIYELVAKINHMGNANSGHYWMIRYTNNKTIAINDMQIMNINDNNNSSNTYMLFYVKKE
jgi:ubiquitin C-terminal hydrolase